MAQGTVANTIGLMKRLYIKGINSTFSNRAWLWNQFGQGKATAISDEGARFPLHLEPNFNFSFYGDGGVLPAGSSEVVKQAAVYYTNFVLPVALTGQAIDATKAGSQVAYASNLTFHMQKAAENAVKIMNILFCKQNGSGSLGTATGTPSTTSVTMASPDGTRYVRNGMSVSFIIPASGAVRSTGTITAVNPTTDVLTFGTALSTAPVSGDLVVAEGSYNRAIHGLPYHVDDASGIWQEIDRGTYATARSQVVDASSTLLNTSLLSQIVAKLRNAMGEERFNASGIKIISWSDQVYAYLTLGYELKRFQEMKFDASFTSYSFQGIEWREEADMTAGDIYILTLGAFELFGPKELSWDETNGVLLNRDVDQATGRYKDSYTAYLNGRFDVGCDSPAIQGRLKALTVPAGFEDLTQF